MPQFAKWLAFLDELGYKTKWGILNTKDFGIPQNRARCFAVSVLGDYYYDMPKGFTLKKRLKDVLEKNVDESYYLKEETIKALNIHKQRHEAKGNGFGWKPTDGGGYAKSIKTDANDRHTDNFIIEQSREEIGKIHGACEYTDGERLQGLWQSTYERSNGSGETQVLSRPHGYNRGGIEEKDIFPTIRKSSTIDGNNGVVEWKK